MKFIQFYPHFLSLTSTLAAPLQDTTDPGLTPLPIHNLVVDPVLGEIGDLDLDDPVIRKLLDDPKFTTVYKDWFKNYHSNAAHDQFLRGLSSTHHNQSTIFVPGQSFEQRNIQGIHIWGQSGPGVKPAVVFHGTAHAREWITTMVIEYMAYRLLTRYGQDEDVTEVLDNHDFYIIPVVNPDGFVYSQTTLRNWRKTRQTRGKGCVGTDLNRNWNVEWHQRNGSSISKCSEAYKGEAPHDAPETAALAAHMAQVKTKQGLKLFIDWHSFGQVIMYPYGFTCNQSTHNRHLKAIADDAARAMKAVHGTVYQTGTACELMYTTTGSAEDYAYDVAGAEYAFTIELRPGSNSRHKFHLPESQIQPTGEEAFAGVLQMLRSISLAVNLKQGIGDVSE